METALMDKITLTCTQGGSNKQYTLWLEEQDGGWNTKERMSR